ncbi:Hypothetical predicted protein [Paramuricea clavata]|uniref:Uncharacterized protein n=1 Tax=Paramuricea clavata TaxID=317549 RepID=A0A6S7I8X0_PARCT|nr:Hypothetical predicted protein [Paramuricea clavata]
MDAEHSQIGFEIEALQSLLIISDPDFENNLFTRTPSNSPSTILTNPISILPQSTTPVNPPTSTSQSPNTIDTSQSPNTRDTTPTSTQTQPSTLIVSPTAIPIHTQKHLHPNIPNYIPSNHTTKSTNTPNHQHIPSTYHSHQHTPHNHHIQ